MQMGKMLSFLTRSKPQLDEQDVAQASRSLVADGVCTTSMVTLQGGPFLAAFAIALGASNYEVGLLATIALLSQMMQVPGLFLAQSVRKRRAIVLLAAAAARALWVFIILIPLLFLNRGVTFLMQWLFLSALVGAVAGPAWNSLIRDSIPTEQLGRVFSKRMVLGTGFAIAFTLSGGFFVDAWQARFPDAPLYAYSVLFAVGLAFGLGGVFFISRMPEPEMRGDSAPFLALLMAPAKDANFRGLLKFIVFWSFAVNLAAPFFIVYLLDRIGVPLGLVTLLVVTSQVTNMAFVRIWGKLADRFSNKSVLSVSGPMFMVAVAAWTFTTLPERHFLTVPMLFLIQVLSGMSLAGVTLAATNVALKLSPEGQGHSYMAAYGMAGAAAGALAPMLGGIFADFFAARELAVSINWSAPGRDVQAHALNFKALDFLFAGAVVAGFFSLRFLRDITEEGEADKRMVRDEFMNEAFATFRSISTVVGLRALVAGPVSAVQGLMLSNRQRMGGAPTASSAEEGVPPGGGEGGGVAEPQGAVPAEEAAAPEGEPSPPHDDDPHRFGHEEPLDFGDIEIGQPPPEGGQEEPDGGGLGGEPFPGTPDADDDEPTGGNEPEEGR